jgi:phosphatidylglycerol---prolipoprotein diacylglyceryl transferase
MYPVLFTIGSFSVSTFGLFLALALLVSGYFFWRGTRIYEIDEEVTLDLFLLTFFASLVGSRLHFILAHLSVFDSVAKLFLVNRYPGLSFWGGLAVGGLTLVYLCQRFKLRLWDMVDLAGAVMLIGLAIGNIGCFLGGCQVGLPYEGSIAVKMVGIVGERFPLQLFEAAVFLGLFAALWRMACRFHSPGKVAALTLFYLGIIKFFFEFFYALRQIVIGPVGVGHLAALGLIGYGWYLYYKKTKRVFKEDVMKARGIFTDSSRRRVYLSRVAKRWYNTKVTLIFTLRSRFKTLKRVLKITSTPRHF